MGFQESPPQPRSTRQGLARAWWIVLVIVAFAMGMWIGGRKASPPAVLQPSAPGSEERAAEARVDPYAAQRVEALRNELGEAQRQLELQRRQIAELEATLETARDDSERHRQGLRQAVDELNRIQGELDRLRSQARVQTGPSMPSPPRAGVRPLGGPTVTVHQMGFVVASGLVHNPFDYSVRGSLEVSLVGSAGVIESRRFPMSIPADSTERYDLTFTNIFPTERLGAQARWVE